MKEDDTTRPKIVWYTPGFVDSRQPDDLQCIQAADPREETSSGLSTTKIVFDRHAKNILKNVRALESTYHSEIQGNRRQFPP